MSKNINRYKFTTEFLNEIKLFCKKNNSLNDDDFKKYFNKWKIDNFTILNKEETYLKSIGYEGNFIQKLDKSINHYFKKIYKKTQKNTNKCDYLHSNVDDSNVDTKCVSTINLNIAFNKKLKIRDYLILDFDFLQLIDNHINRHISGNTKIKPSILFNEFSILYSNEINEQIKKLNDVLENIDKCNNKIKKTYQNRYYNINKKL